MRKAWLPVFFWTAVLWALVVAVHIFYFWTLDWLQAKAAMDPADPNGALQVLIDAVQFSRWILPATVILAVLVTSEVCYRIYRKLLLARR